LTLIVNATTTGALVRYLGLSHYSDLKKNILHGLTHQMDKNVTMNIEILKEKRHFNHVDWENLRKSVELLELKNSLKQYQNLEVNDIHQSDYEHEMGNADTLKALSKKINAVEEQK